MSTLVELWIAGPCQGGASTLLTDMEGFTSYRDDIIKATDRFELVDGKRIIEWDNQRLVISDGGNTIEYTSRLATHPSINVVMSGHYLELANMICKMIS